MSLGPWGTIRSPKLPSVIFLHEAGECGERAIDGVSHHQRRQDGGDEECHDHRDQYRIPPVLHRIELVDGMLACLRQVLVLIVEQHPQFVELCLAALGGAGIEHLRHAGCHTGDKGIRVRGSPRRRGRLDGIQIGDQFGPVAHPVPDLLRCIAFGPLPSVVRLEELGICGDRISAYSRLLITQCGLQLIRRDARRLDVEVQFLRHGVGPVQQERTGHRAGEHHDAHDRQHQALPALYRRLPFHPVVVRSTRTTAMSSLIPPTD